MSLHQTIQATWDRTQNDTMLLIALTKGSKGLTAQEIVSELQQLTTEQQTKMGQLINGLTGPLAVEVKALLQ